MLILYIKHQQNSEKLTVYITRMLQKIAWFINIFVLNLQFCNKYVKMYNRAICGSKKWKDKWAVELIIFDKICSDECIKAILERDKIKILKHIIH